MEREGTVHRPSGKETRLHNTFRRHTQLRQGPLPSTTTTLVATLCGPHTSRGGTPANALGWHHNCNGQYLQGAIRQLRSGREGAGRLLILHLKKGSQHLHIAAVHGATGNEGLRERGLVWEGLREAVPGTGQYTLFVAGDFNMVEMPDQKSNEGWRAPTSLGVKRSKPGKELRPP